MVKIENFRRQGEMNAVELTAREAHDRDYVVTLIKDATESADEEAKNASLKFLSRIAEITTTELLVKL